MKYLTMVSRYGDLKKDINYMNFTLIGDDFSIHQMRGDKLAAYITAGKVNVTNMGVSVKGLESTNGSINNYTTIALDGTIVGKPRCVILNRIEKANKLVGYVVYGVNGVVTEISVEEAVKMCNAKLIANGKIKHTENGDIVSSIKGNYPLVNTIVKETPDKLTTKTIYFGEAMIGRTNCKYAGVIVNTKYTKTISNMYAMLTKANEKVINKLHDIGYSEDELEQFKLKQAPGAGIYGVYELSDAKKLTENGEAKYDKVLIIGCRDCSDMDNIESLIIYDIKSKSVKVSQSGTGKSDEELKKFKDSILESL